MGARPLSPLISSGPMRSVSVLLLFLLLSLTTAPLQAQTMRSTPEVPHASHAAGRPLLAIPLRATVVPPRRFWFSMLAGASTGAALGGMAVSMTGVPSDQVGIHRFRAGATYGVMGGVLAGALSLRGAARPEPSHSFWIDRWNTPLLLGMAATQTLDYTSTRYFRERGKDEWLLTNGLVDHRAAFVATEVSAVASATALAWIFHRTGHHRLERIFEAGYITVGITSAIANYRYPAVGHALF